ncbi:unnamed protein product, partial [Polarella glacialis]
MSAAVVTGAVSLPLLAKSFAFDNSLTGTLVFGTITVTILLAAAGLLSRAVFFLGKDEQVRRELFTETAVVNGPGIKLVNPLGYRKATKIKAQMLGTMDFVKIKDSLTGKERVERGPQLLFLGPYEEVKEGGQGITLSKTEYLTVTDQLSGNRVVARGPCVWFPTTPHEKASGRHTAIALQEDEYIRLKDEATGQRWVQQGKALVVLESTWKVEGEVRKAWTLKTFEYVRLLDSVTGKVTVHTGEKTVFPGPNENLLDGDKLSAIDLKVDEYVRLEDQSDGEIRVVAGTSQVFLGPNERVMDGGKKKAIQVDEEHAALVRDASTGQQSLKTDKQLFVPGPHEKIEEVRDLIKLADHEAMIIKDKDGQLHFHYGNHEKHTSTEPKSSFLQPYAEIVQLWWSSGLRRAKRDLCIERFDCRAQYMWFEFDCRTTDNVELVLEVTMFWEAVDLAKMIRSTGNLPGDVYNQARSQFIKHVAKVTLKRFMDELHSISSSIHTEDANFYESRGVKIHSLEVTRYSCSDKRTSEVLQQIIEETTNRLNRLSQAESENEVKLFRMQGLIEQEKMNEELLQIQQKHTRAEAHVAGAAEAERVAAFVQGLAEPVPKLEDRIMMWQVLRKTDALTVISEGGGNLYYTPNDVDLSIRTD